MDSYTDTTTQTTLLSLLANPLIFDQTCAGLSIGSLLKLASTSRSFQSLIQGSHTAFRYLDLSTAKGASVDIAPIDRGGELWRNERIDEGVTEEDFYSGPLRGILSSLRRKNVLEHVSTLILDNQTAPAEVLHDIICSDKYNVQILSLLESKHLNEIKLRKSLGYAVRPSRPENTPRLKGLYIFGARHLSVDPALPSGVTDSIGAQLGKSFSQVQLEAQAVNPWYAKEGRVIAQSKRLDEWAPTIFACRGIIAFDAVLCHGPKHYVGDDRAYIDPAIASVKLKGCEFCHTTPEGPVSTKEAPSDKLPLLSPPPRYTTSIKLAQKPSLAGQLLYARCTACVSQRCCEGCFKFWCEDCHNGEIAGRGDTPHDQGTKRSCWECGRLCHKCNKEHEKVCRACLTAFCKKHTEMLSTCDWCRYSRRRGREMY